jgi:hypothetical protein
MKVSDKDSETNVYDNYEEAYREDEYVYSVSSFKINGKVYFIPTWE